MKACRVGLLGLLILNAGCHRPPQPSTDAASTAPAVAGDAASASPKIAAAAVPVDTKPLESRDLSERVHLDVYPGEKAGEVVWVYLPKPMPEKPGVVLVAPAGGTLRTSPALEEGDRPEHLPYVAAGFVTVSFSLPGVIAEPQSDATITAAVKDFRARRAGVNAEAHALDLVLHAVPDVDPKRVYAAGHSSAGTLALLFAALDRRVRAVAAFAPVSDALTRADSEVQQALEQMSPGFTAFMKWESPASHVSEYAVPVFLFHAKDDGNVPYADSQKFADALKSHGVATTFISAQTGDHYDSMINEGLPAAVAWFGKLAAEQK